MKKTQIFLIFLVAALTSVLTVSIFNWSQHLDKAPQQSAAAKPQKKLLFYRNPMNPEVTSPVPMKDQMGMDYVPVYEEEGARDTGGIHMSLERQQLIGLKKGKVEKVKLTREISAYGQVAYDPELFTAQEEYLQALKTRNKIYGYSTALLKKQAMNLLNASQEKLRLLGMSGEEIKNLAKTGKAQESLILPAKEGVAWVYISVYEYEISLVKEGAGVRIESAAHPGEVFEGNIAAITPVLDQATRSLRVRVRVKDSEHKLKPQMYVNATILADLGEKMAVPEDAVLDTGARKIVYVVKNGDTLEARKVNLGQRASGYYEVLDGLREGEEVVTSGNFLVDSESKLSGVSAEIDK